MPNSTIQTTPGRLITHGWIYEGLQFAGLKMHLAGGASFTLADDMTLLTVTECGFEGYSPQFLSGWTAPEDLGTYVEIRADEREWENGDPEPVTIRGWFVTNPDDEIVYAFKYGTPKVIAPGETHPVPFAHRFRNWP